jgi:hypothetical protein
MNRTIVTMVRSMTLDCADVIFQVLWADACSMAVHIKNRLPHSAFKLKKLLYEIMFGDKPSIKTIYIPLEQNVMCMYLKRNRSGHPN